MEAVLPELRQLRTFIAVAEELNFTRAAERVHLAQQAVSKSVRQLERELGVELLQRTTREVRLTPAGASLLHHGRDALAAADAAFERARDIGLGLTGTVRVGVTPAIGPGDRREIVEALRDGAPEVSVSLLEVRPGDVARLLRDRDFDLAVTRTRADAPDIEHTPLRPTPLQLAAPEGHPAAASAEPVSLRALDGTSLLVWSPPGTPFTDMLLDLIATAGATVTPVESRVTGGQSLHDLAERGTVALVPADWPETAGVRLLTVAEMPALPLVVQWATGTLPAAVSRLRSAMGTRAV